MFVAILLILSKLFYLNRMIFFCVNLESIHHQRSDFNISPSMINDCTINDHPCIDRLLRCISIQTPSGNLTHQCEKFWKKWSNPYIVIGCKWYLVRCIFTRVKWSQWIIAAIFGMELSHLSFQTCKSSKSFNLSCRWCLILFSAAFSIEKICRSLLALYHHFNDKYKNGIHFLVPSV